MICPEATAEELIKGLEKITEEGIQQDIEDNGPEAIIEREYFNHETQLSRDQSGVMDALSIYKELYPDKFTKELIKEVFSRCFEDALQNEWF